MNITNDDLWNVFEFWFSQHGAAHHQIQAYNEFVEKLLPNIIREKGRIVIGEDEDKKPKGEKKSEKGTWFKEVEFTNPAFGELDFAEIDGLTRPLFPFDARTRGIPYVIPLTCDVVITTADGKVTKEKKTVAHIPVMVGSNLCNLVALRRNTQKGQREILMREDPLDKGGYFIINREIMVICSERGAFGRVYTYSEKQMPRGMPKYDVHSEIRVSATSTTRTTTAYVGLENGLAVFYGQHISSSGVPLCVLMEALGVSYLDLLKYIKLSDKHQRSFLVSSLENARGLFPKSRKCREETQQKALRMIDAKLTVEELVNLVFPCYKKVEEKVWFLCYMLARAIKVKVGEREAEDRDHYANKRVDCVDTLLNNLFYSVWNQMVKTVHDSCLEKGRTTDPLRAIQTGMITKKLIKALTTGNWNSYNTKSKKTGTSQNYERYNVIAAVSNLRKLHAAIGTEGNMTKPRRVHESSYGFVDPADTPESKERTGLSKVMGLGATLSLGCSFVEFFEILSSLDDFLQDFGQGTFIFLNGMIVGSTRNPVGLVSTLSGLKTSNNICWDSCFVYDKYFDEVRINCDAGRLIRPLMVVKDGGLVFTSEDAFRLRMTLAGHEASVSWQEFLTRGIVEFVDAEQQEHLVICPDVEQLNKSIVAGKSAKWTHCELHPLLVYGVCSSIISYSNNNPSPRLSYFASMAKSSVAVPRCDYMYVPFDQHVLHYPQKPLTSTKAGRLLGLQDSPISQNLVVGVCCFDDYGMEDAIVACKSFKERSGMVSEHIQNFVAEIGHEQTQVALQDICPDILSESCKRLWCKRCERCVIKCPECNDEYVPEDVGFKGVRCRAAEEKRRKVVNEGIAKWNKNLKEGQKPLDFLAPRLKDEKSHWMCLCKEVRKEVRIQHLDEDGIVAVGEVVEEGDILVAISEEGEEGKKKDKSLYFGKDKKGTVTSVSYSRNNKGNICIRIAVTSVRIPQVGDKATSFHSQKGTFSLFVPEENMPFNPDPYCASHPDFLINPLAFPSRMTIGQPKESSAGKVTACALRKTNEEKANDVNAELDVLRKGILERMRNERTPNYSGSFTDCSPFTSNFEIVESELKRRGYAPGGKEFYIDGMTGKSIEVQACLLELVPLQPRLKHMVVDKIHARATGKIQSLTRQPTEGRSRNGGLKIGSMERDCLVGNGATFCLRDRLFTSCDKFEVWVCTTCGQIATKHKDGYVCRPCHGKSNVSRLPIRYSTKLAFQELMAMGIMPRILLQ
ncbi:hypothetical protein GMAR_ORF274 [Golden Marseillevirus]|uniref:hypothetical protein n=1 Tax=Golden Marseillevirus TaxID=1720526 RepID=UPI000877AD8C|nr:hypothetical protein GMAR_ORF274 [Golden Marseillevirus]ALX27648.1 hypothetical protein GMAR_ORF274 [Golden Marseillevirus]